MNLKCVKCNEEAEYVFGGNSLCSEHLPMEIKKKILPIYKGSNTTIQPKDLPKGYSSGVGGGLRV